MLNILRRGGRVSRDEKIGPDWRPDDEVVWIDLCDPSREEEIAVEGALGLQLPTREEMQALEPSSRLYQEGGATFVTATLLAHAAETKPTATPVTFVLAHGVLVTLRYDSLRAFAVYSERCREHEAASGVAVFLSLLDAVVERLAEVIDGAGDAVEAASAGIFERPQAGNFRPVMTALAQAQSLTSLARNSLVSLARALNFVGLARELGETSEHPAHLRSLQQDLQSLTEHASYQSSHIGFLLDAALGLINIEQNGIIKFFSVVAVVFLPPTLVASIYGMNFDVMPELHWTFGYPMAVVAMVASAVLPILWFKRRGWL
jgi:magnesium transporter